MRRRGGVRVIGVIGGGVRMMFLKTLTILTIRLLIDLSKQTEDCHSNVGVASKSNSSRFKALPLLKKRESINLDEYYPSSSLTKYKGPLRKKMFEKFSRLESLLIIDSQITSMESRLFEPLTNLNVAFISESKLPDLKRDAFGNCPQLKLLGILTSEFNDIEGESFKALNNLTGLKIEYTPITIIRRDTFKGLTELLSLYVVGNFISVVEKGAFNDLHSIRTLDLSYNKLKEVPVEELKKLTTLKHLDLSWNEIESFEADELIGSLERLKFFTFSGNKLPCDQLKKLKEDVRKRNVNVTAVQVECVTT